MSPAMALGPGLRLPSTMDETVYFAQFGAEKRKFWLPMPRVVAAEREMACAIGQLYFDLGSNLGLIAETAIIIGPLPARLKNCHHLIRNALIGGGESEETAGDLIDVYAYPARPASRDFELAYRILQAAVDGVQPDLSKKKPPAKPRVRSARAK